MTGCFRKQNQNGITEHIGKMKNAFSLNKKHFVMVLLQIRILIFMRLTVERHNREIVTKSIYKFLKLWN